MVVVTFGGRVVVVVQSRQGGTVVVELETGGNVVLDVGGPIVVVAGMVVDVSGTVVVVGAPVVVVIDGTHGSPSGTVAVTVEVIPSGQRPCTVIVTDPPSTPGTVEAAAVDPFPAIGFV